MLNRLLGIVYSLMKNRQVKASDLAERYEVSVRTIYRDVETLSMAGIPLYTMKGRNGGIRLMEQFVLDKLMVSEEEQKQILAALNILDQTGAQEEQVILEKLKDFFQVDAPSWVSIDLSDWSGKRQGLFEMLKQSVLKCRVLEFDYYGQFGDMSHRSVEPVRLVFKDYTWYLSAYCRNRKAIRLFKVLRMKRVELTEESFASDLERYDNPEENVPLKQPEPHNFTKIALEIEKREAYRVYDRFEEEEITVKEDGSFLVQIDCPLDEWIYGVILSFGPSAKVLKPDLVREEVSNRVKRMADYYQ